MLQQSEFQSFANILEIGIADVHVHIALDANVLWHFEIVLSNSTRSHFLVVNGHLSVLSNAVRQRRKGDCSSEAPLWIA